jgi:hypothetical protein
MKGLGPFLYFSGPIELDNWVTLGCRHCYSVVNNKMIQCSKKKIKLYCSSKGETETFPPTYGSHLKDLRLRNSLHYFQNGQFHYWSETEENWMLKYLSLQKTRASSTGPVAHTVRVQMLLTDPEEQWGVFPEIYDPCGQDPGQALNAELLKVDFKNRDYCTSEETVSPQERGFGRSVLKKFLICGLISLCKLL